ncbi:MULTISPECIES: cell division protein SepF [Auritidibacter]|uniref:cell division protein SepF n=1 Tax=Auritidibacter TaxID=1160973 RepID=UPI000D738F39|nr:MULTISPECIES: cell division protein SepF [Auritidibacter]PXA78005.1 cell division protein SepF [Auritidibacter sp. NML120779]AXR73701.1 cell division protein SepF [Auritidibacter sp. NML130574]PXA76395.1 cell division protein SepF [Auritidibacter sp. NML100628]PXA81375.1 cell division protein SepF [Auritidibacter sp. NML120636]RMX23616.1 cell division protein SepF [Auritidibacter ignavus]
MVGGMKKAMIYLGLADGDEHYEQEQQQKAEATASRSESRSQDRGTSRSKNQAEADEQQAKVAEPVNQMPTLRREFSPVRAVPSPDNSSEDGDDNGYRAPVTPIKRATQTREEASEVHQLNTIHPRSYNDAKLIGESFRSGVPVIMNVTDMSEAEAKRLVDFSAGLVFGLYGSIERVTNKVFLLTPNTVEVITEGSQTNEEEVSFFNQA